MRRHMIEETEGGQITTIPRTPFNDVQGIRITREGSTVVAQFSFVTGPSSSGFIRRSYRP